jgi:FkbH-like protein
MKKVMDILARTDITKTNNLISSINKIQNLAKNWDQTARIYILRNYTIENIEPYLKYHHYLSGIDAEITFGKYDQFQQEILLQDSDLYGEKHPDVIVLSMMLETFEARYWETNWDAETTWQRIQRVLEALRQNSSSLILLNSFLLPFYTLGRRLKSDKIGQIQFLNDYLLNYVSQYSNQFFCIDFNVFLRILGEEKSIDYRFWYSSKAPFRKEFLNLYALSITCNTRSLLGKSKKCAVLDCDNTLWGGVVGEDGLGGIKLDNDSYPGKIFYEFQQTLLLLKNQGVMLALCSKNNEIDVWEVFEKHPYSLLKKDDFVAWRVNWNNKAQNLLDLSDELNIGLDSFVFVDDSSSECELIRNFHPEVTVYQVPSPLYPLPDLLLKDGLFYNISRSEEDINRSTLYIEEATRTQTRKSCASIEEYLASLKLEAVIHEMTLDEIPRVSQLTQKTNQFNLTTKRYSEMDIKNFSIDNDISLLTLRASDKFGDYGLTGVLIARAIESTILIDSLLLSCRVLGKNLEFIFVSYCMNFLIKKWPYKKWISRYMPTNKNNQVREFWDKFGFSLNHSLEMTNEYQMDENQRKSFLFDYIKVNP